MRKKYTRQAGMAEDYFYWIGVIVLLTCIGSAAIFFLCPNIWRRIRPMPCLFHLFTGYYCPGCGGTRAVRELLKGHIVKSVYYHPLVLYGAVLYLCFMVTQTIERVSRGHIPIGMRYRNCYVWFAMVIILLNFVVKNVLHYFYGFVM